MRRRRLGQVISAVAVSACAVSVGAAIAKPPPTGGTSTATIAAKPNPVVYGSPTTISGVITGKHASGATVTLQSDPYPYTAPFSKAKTTTATATGRYTFRISPSLNTTYQVVAHTAPQATSPKLIVRVRVKMTLQVSSTKPAAGQRVRFSGFVLPAYNGKSVVIQRKSATGWTTITSAKLLSGSPVKTVFGMTPRSMYGKRLRVLRSGTYRVYFNPRDGRLLANASAIRKLTVH
jgi:hypothetical protein